MSSAAPGEPPTAITVSSHHVAPGAFAAAVDACTEMHAAAHAAGRAQERQRILAGVNQLLDSVDALSDDCEDYMLKIGFQAQQEVLESVRVLIGDPKPAVVAGGGGTENGDQLEAFADGYGAGHVAGAAQALVHEPVSACGVPRCGILGVHEHTIYGGGGTENGDQPCHGSTCLSGPGLHARTGSCVSGAADGGDT